jgi:hypothetical protein
MNGDVVAAVYESAVPFGQGGPSPISCSDLHSDLLHLGKVAAGAIPNLDLASIRIVAQDPTSTLSNQPHAVLGIDMYAGLDCYEQAQTGTGRKLAVKIFGEGMSGQAVERPLVPWTTKTATIRIGGLPSPSTSRTRVAKLVSQRGLADPSAFAIEDDHISATMTGDPLDIAVLCSKLVDGILSRQRPLYIEVRGITN